MRAGEFLSLVSESIDKNPTALLQQEAAAQAGSERQAEEGGDDGAETRSLAEEAAGILSPCESSATGG
jgi:hypothetical protein